MVSVDRLRMFGRVISAISVVFLAAGMAGYAVHNLGNRYFWTDESLTFFTGRGFPPVGEQLGSIDRAWQGVGAFLDPGLFQILGRFWTLAFGTGILSLRMLPFLLLLAYALSLIIAFRLLGAPIYLAVGGTSLMFLENITPNYGVEFRPYSGGLAASVAIPVAALALVRSPTWLRLAFLGVAVVFLGSMQFNTMPIAWATTLVLTIAALRCSDTRRRVLLLVGAGVTFLWLPAVYLITRGNPVVAGGGKALSYIPDMVLSSMAPDRLLHVILSNVLSPTALPRSVFLVVVPILWWRRLLPSLRANRTPIETSLNLLWLLVLTALASTVLLASLGFIPWIVGTRWSIGEIGMIGLSLAGLVGLVLRTKFPSRRWGAAALMVVAVFAAAVGAYRLWAYERPNDVDYVRALGTELLSGQPGGVVVDSWLFLDLRYWMEFSGQYDVLRDSWLTQGVVSSEGLRAGPSEVQAFLDSNKDRMLLRGQSVLDEMSTPLPANVSVLTIPEEMVIGPLAYELPILLVKK